MEHQLIDAIVEKDASKVLEAAIGIGKQFSNKVANKKFGGRIYQFLKQEINSELSPTLEISELGLVKDFMKLAKSKL